MRRFVGLLFVLLSLMLAAPALAETRVALVIGNSAYKHAPALANPKNDAEGMAAALRRLGFEVLAGTDLEKPAMDKLLQAFADKLEKADVALVFYAGHGLQVNGRNYLVPTDGKLDKESDLVFQAVSLDTIQGLMEQGQRTSIMILDACRDNPLARNLARSMGTRSAGIGRGLGAAQAGVGTLIVYATQPGNVALDGDVGANSPFTAALLAHLETKGLEVRQVLTRVRQAVIEKTKGKQVPWDSSSLTGDFFFVASAREAPPAETKPPTPTPPAATDTPQLRGPSADSENLFWQSIQNSKNAADYKAYLEKCPNGTFAALAKIRLAEIEKAASVTPPPTPKPAKPAPQQPEPQRRIATFEAGVMITSDQQFDRKNVADPPTCQAICIQNPYCTAWSWFRAQNRCLYHQSASLVRTRNEESVSGEVRKVGGAKPQPAVLPGDEQGLIREMVRRAQSGEPENGFCARTKGWISTGFGSNSEARAAFGRLIARVPASGGTLRTIAKENCAFARVSAERVEGGKRCKTVSTWMCMVGGKCLMGTPAGGSTMCELTPGRFAFEGEPP